MYYRFCKSNPINIRCLWWPVCTHSTHQVYLRIPHDLGVSWCISVYRTTDHGVYLGVSLKSAANSNRTVLAWLPHPTQALQGLASPESSPQWTAGTAHIGCRIKPLRCNLGGEMKYLKQINNIFCNILQWTALLRLFVLMFYLFTSASWCIWWCDIMWNRLTIVHEMQDLFPTRHLHHIGRTPQALGSSGLARHGAWMVPGEWVDPLFWRRISISISENMKHIIFGIFWTCHVHLCE